MPGVNDVPKRLRHFLATRVLHVANHHDVLVDRRVLQQHAERVQRVEPAACLVNGLADEVCGELVFEHVLVLKRVVPLCVRHRARIKPGVEHFWQSLHRAVTLLAP